MNFSCTLVRRSLATLLLALAASPALTQSRGELLYTTHCVACHSMQMHWRDNKLAVDWPTLLAQVQQWQAAAQLAWSADDVERVARYLNDSSYHFKAPVRPLARGPAAAVLAGVAAAPLPAR
jgi:cytochrome c1